MLITGTVLPQCHVYERSEAVTVVLTTTTCICTCRNLTRTNQIDLIIDRASASYICCLLAAHLDKVNGSFDGHVRDGIGKGFLILHTKQHMHGGSYTQGLANGLA